MQAEWSSLRSMPMVTISAPGSSFIFRIHDRSFSTSRADDNFLEQHVAMPERVSYFFPHGAEIFGINV